MIFLSKLALMERGLDSGNTLDRRWPTMHRIAGIAKFMESMVG